MTAVRPREAASLVLVRAGRDGSQVLMGRRRRSARFMPDVFVFPGGRLDPADRAVAPGRPLGFRAGPLISALANTAIRETWEETGLMVGTPSGPAAPWAGFTAAGLAPDHGTLHLIARAITPVSSRIRFHARFFAADASAALGTLAGDGELTDLDWYPVRRALQLPIIDVTEFVLNEVDRRFAGPAGEDAAGVPLFAYRRDKAFVRR